LTGKKIFSSCFFGTISTTTPIQRRGRVTAPSSGGHTILTETSYTCNNNNGNNNNNNNNNSSIGGLGGSRSNHSNKMGQFDNLKRDATKLERNLEDKVARYQQLVQSIPDSTNNDLFLAETGMGGNSSTSVEDEATLRHDIQRTLTTLQDLVTTQLQPASEKLGSQSSSLLVKRYREILFDLTGDFEKSRQAHTRKMERIRLMEGSASKNKNNSLEIDNNPDKHLMREFNHISNSQSAAAAVINQATEIRNELRSQGLSFGRISAGMGQIMGNIPGINTIVEKIKRKKSKNDMILIGVISSCILFTVWYLFG